MNGISKQKPNIIFKYLENANHLENVFNSNK